MGNGFQTTSVTVSNAPAGARVRMTYLYPDTTTQTAEIPVPPGSSTQRVVTSAPSGTTVKLEMLAGGLVVYTAYGPPVP